MKYQMFRDAQNQWRWRLLAANGQSIAVSGEGYKNKQDCQYAIGLVKNSADAPVVELWM